MNEYSSIVAAIIACVEVGLSMVLCEVVFGQRRSRMTKNRIINSRLARLSQFKAGEEKRNIKTHTSKQAPSADRRSEKNRWMGEGKKSPPP